MFWKRKEYIACVLIREMAGFFIFKEKENTADWWGGAAEGLADPDWASLVDPWALHYTMIPATAQGKDFDLFD